MSGITTHVLDVARGRPAEGVPIALETRSESGSWIPLGQGATDSDGRLRSLIPAGYELRTGVYRITFDTSTYFRGLETESFYPEVQVLFTIREAAQHYHVPLLLSPYGYSTYRGS